MDIPDLGIREIPHSRKAVICRAASVSESTVVTQFPELFNSELGCCKKHSVKKIPFKSGINIKQIKKPHSLGAAEDELVWIEVQKLLKDGVIEETSEEPHVIPAFTVAKGDGGRRLVLDFRRMNSYVRKEPFLNMNKDHSVASVQPFSVGSTLDLNQAFHQVEIHPDLKRYFGFSVQGRFYVFKRLPFGYVNSSFEFLRAVQKTVIQIRKEIRSQLIFFFNHEYLKWQQLNISATEISHNGCTRQAQSDWTRTEVTVHCSLLIVQSAKGVF